MKAFSFSIYILEVGGWLDSKLSLQYHIVQPFTWYNSSDMVASVRFIYFSRLSLAAYRMWMGVPSSRYFAGFAGKYVFLLSSVYPSLASAGAKVFAMVFFNLLWGPSALVPLSSDVFPIIQFKRILGSSAVSYMIYLPGAISIDNRHCVIRQGDWNFITAGNLNLKELGFEGLEMLWAFP